MARKLELPAAWVPIPPQALVRVPGRLRDIAQRAVNRSHVAFPHPRLTRDAAKLSAMPLVAAGTLADFVVLQFWRVTLVRRVVAARARDRTLTAFAEVAAAAEAEATLTDAIFTFHRSLAKHVVGKLRHVPIERDDVCQIADTALVLAMRGFCPWDGYQFSTYVFASVRNAILREGAKVARRPRGTSDAALAPAPRREYTDIELADAFAALNASGLTEQDAALVRARLGFTTSVGGTPVSTAELVRDSGVSRSTLVSRAAAAMRKIQSAHDQQFGTC